MTTIDDARARLRTDLDDLDPAAYRWTDTELDRAINHALNALSAAIPREFRTTLQTTPGSRDISLATLKPRTRVAYVEYPTGQYPPVYVPFSVWGDLLTLLIDSAPSTAANVNIYWHAAHVLDQSGSSLEGPLVDILLDGATAYAADQWTSYATNRINLGGPEVSRQYAALANRKMQAFRAALKRAGPAASVRISRLYTPEEPAPTQSTDPGP
jgi:hypothetical protein